MLFVLGALTPQCGIPFSKFSSHMTTMYLLLGTGAQAGWPLTREVESHPLLSRLPGEPLRDDANPILYILRNHQGSGSPGLLVQQHDFSLSPGLSLLSSSSARILWQLTHLPFQLPACSETVSLLWICDQAHILPNTSFLPRQPREVSENCIPGPH